MKRSPLRRKTALPRNVVPLRRTGALPAQSAKRKAIVPERKAFCEQILRRRPWCQRPGCHNASTDVHELVRRSQGSPIVPSQGLDEADVLALCRPCHRQVTDNPAWAVAQGLARWGMRGA